MQLNCLTLSYPTIFGRPWLFDAKARKDWSCGTLAIGR